MTRELPAADDLRHRVAHVVGREELALLDVHDAAGLGRRDEQVGLPRQERRDLQHVGDLGRRRRLRRPRGCRSGSARRCVALMAARIRRPSSRPGPRNDVPDVRLALSYDALKMKGTPARRAMAASSPAEVGGVLLALDDAGPRDEHERAPAAEGDVADGDRIHGLHYRGLDGPFQPVPPSLGVRRPTRWPDVARAPSCAGTPPRRSSRRAGAGVSAST